MQATTFDAMIGATMASVTGSNGDEAQVFTTTDGRVFTFYHAQDCCESVSIEDVCGDLDDLVGSPLLMAEEVSNEDEPTFENADYTPESYTWTFYKFATAKGSVTVRWLGTSNGYYGEGVSFSDSANPSRW